jgi:hypothetical protein
MKFVAYRKGIDINNWKKKSRLQTFSAFAQNFFKPNGMNFEIQ